MKTECLQTKRNPALFGVGKGRIINMRVEEVLERRTIKDLIGTGQSDQKV